MRLCSKASQWTDADVRLFGNIWNILHVNSFVKVCSCDFLLICELNIVWLCLSFFSSLTDNVTHSLRRRCQSFIAHSRAAQHLTHRCFSEKTPEMCHIFRGTSAAEDLCVQDSWSNRKSSMKTSTCGNSNGLINEPKSKNYQQIHQ